MDYYLNEGNCFDRVWNEYKKYGSLIVAVDWDGTLNDFHNEGLSFNNVIDLIKRCNDNQFKVVVFTANNDYIQIINECNRLGIKIEGVNKQILPEFQDSFKLYYNILLDDRAGLSTSYKILKKVLDKIENKVYTIDNELERLSKLIHEECWMTFAKGIIKEENLTKEREQRWKTLFVLYEELSEYEKEKDRKIARRFLND